ncbi:hypothetical protein JCM3774_006710 [Rhodotorula dairenensis]
MSFLPAQPYPPRNRVYDAPTTLNRYQNSISAYGAAPSAPPRQPLSTCADLASSSPLRHPHQASYAAPAHQPHMPHTSGTHDEPLIPKRRRRTTPAELAILESEYRVKPRPDPIERAHLAERLGMTVRAVQVWYQNRRQKEKRETSCSSSITSTGSDPKDLDGVVLSFSSSPLPSPGLPLHPITGAPSRSALSACPKGAVAAAAAGAAFSGTSVAPSGRLVLQPAVSVADKENVESPTEGATGVRSSHLLTPVSSATVPYRYSYPSQSSGYGSSVGDHHPTSSSGSYAESSHASVFVHRPHNSSIIAAKKHVRKRPLGSHAPLARTPSLPHSFAFPPSPPKTSFVAPAAAARKTLQRSASHSLNAVAGREQKKSAAGLFANSQGETVACAADRRRSMSVSPTTSVPPTLSCAGDSAPTLSRRTGSPEAALTPLPMTMMTPLSKARARDELLQHMQSDPPSTSSPGPIPLTRRRIEQLERSLATREDEDSDDGDGGPPRLVAKAVRPQISRSLSSPNTQATSTLHGAPAADDLAHESARTLMVCTPSYTRASSVPARSAADASYTAAPASSSPAPTAFGPLASHAGADLGVCAIKALGRKRARILEDQSSAAAAAVGDDIVKGRPYVATPGHALSLASAAGRRLGLRIDVARASGGQQQKRRRISGDSIASSSVGTDESSFADLSYSSTSTASTADSLTTVADGDYFGPHRRSAPVGAAWSTSRTREDQAPKSQEDEQRECAELLLGLGGFH